jgi:hypothetical protein
MVTLCNIRPGHLQYEEELPGSMKVLDFSSGRLQSDLADRPAFLLCAPAVTLVRISRL